MAAAKILCEYAEKSKNFEIKAGFVEGKAIDAKEVQELAKMPPKEVLVAKVLGGLNAPISGFANVLSANLAGAGGGAERHRRKTERLTAPVITQTIS